MMNTLRKWLTRPGAVVKVWQDKCLTKLRAHIALAVAEDFRQIALHVTAEREETQSHAERVVSDVAAQLHELRVHFDRRFDELTLVTESLVLEVVRMQQQVAQISSQIADRVEYPDFADPPLAGDAPRVRRAA